MAATPEPAPALAPAGSGSAALLALGGLRQRLQAASHASPGGVRFPPRLSLEDAARAVCFLVEDSRCLDAAAGVVDRRGIREVWCKGSSRSCYRVPGAQRGKQYTVLRGKAFCSCRSFLDQAAAAAGSGGPGDVVCKHVLAVELAALLGEPFVVRQELPAEEFAKAYAGCA